MEPEGEVNKELLQEAVKALESVITALDPRDYARRKLIDDALVHLRMELAKNCKKCGHQNTCICVNCHYRVTILDRWEPRTVAGKGEG